jgi:hypothetical protein
MKNLFQHIFWVLIAVFVLHNGFESIAQPAILINEFMASNSVTIADEDGDFEDWIEIYNSGNEELALQNYGLSDNFNSPFKWTFPDVTIQPGQFLLIWASGKDRINPAEPLHTNFKISADGEELLLTDPSGTRIDESAQVALPTDMSYGRLPEILQSGVFSMSPHPADKIRQPVMRALHSPPFFLIPADYTPNLLNSQFLLRRRLQLFTQQTGKHHHTASARFTPDRL